MRLVLLVVAGVTAALGCGSSGDGDGDGGDDDASGATSSEGSGAEPRACDGFATEVVTVAYGPGAGFGQDAMPGIVLGPPVGAGDAAGSLDVVTLGNGGSITLAFSGQVTDGPGPDFLIFENVFYAGGDPSAPYAEVASVAVSADGEEWREFPCTAAELPFDGCAGWHPTYAGSDPSIDPRDPATAGGDAFDLADVGLPSARFVRVTDRADLVGFHGAFDLDAVALVHWACDAP